MIFMPPRHGKSELASVRFPAWFLGRNPERSIIAASYNSDLASDFGYKVREVVKDRHFSNVFGFGLSVDSQAAGRWRTEQGGSYAAAGVGTAVTGRGADVFLIDDPFKDREAADSEVNREKVWRWYTSTAYTRLEGDLTHEDLEDDDIWLEFEDQVERGDAEPFEGAIVLIQTRWHEDGLAGRLLEKEADGTGDEWDKLILPAISDDETALWPQKFSLQRLRKIEAAIGQRDWSALYQQNPTPDDGTFFKRDWFKRHKMVPKNVSRYICSDYAVTEGSGDYTEHGLFAIDPNETIFIEDWWSGQTSSDVWIESKLDLIEAHEPFCAFGEAGVIQKAVEPMLKKRMRERGVFCRVEWMPSIHDKATRARAFQARAAMGLVSIPEGPMGERILNQLLSFPAGKNDDAVDVCGMIGRVIDQAHPAFVQAPEDKEETSKYRKAFSRQREGGNDWKTL
jgi:predicted phage terminase large subunit-like protein